MRQGASCYAGGEFRQPHFLDSCALCHKKLGMNSDIYMYRGDTPFCSQECRQEQIDMDESTQKRWKISSKKRSNTKDSAKEYDGVRTGTVTVA